MLFRSKADMARLDTPALVLDLDALSANIAKMASFARDNNVSLRPHAKTHKSAEISRLQLEHGAVGICCAKLEEAEILAKQGIAPLLLTSPVRGSAKHQRLLQLFKNHLNTMMVIDDSDHAVEVGELFENHGQIANVLIDCDIGTHRFGVPDVQAALQVAKRIDQSSALRFRGIQGYAGHVQHINDYALRRSESHICVNRLLEIRDALSNAGMPCEIVTGAGTGTHAIDIELQVFTDLQVGSYVCSDVEYDAVDLRGDGSATFANALFVVSRVVSAHHKDFVTTDAGSKSFSLDGPMPIIAFGASEEATYKMFGDEFGRVLVPKGITPPKIGDLIGCIVPHCDPTINLHDRFITVKNGHLAGSWPIDARGGSR